MASKVRIGLIGCGGIMNWHVDNYAKIKQAQIVGLVDTNEACLARMVEKHPELAGVPTFADYTQILKKVDLDGVVIATPHTLHCEQIMTCLKAGINVLSEKPMVCSVADAKKVMKKAEQAGKVMMISYQRHFSPAFRLAKKMIADGKIGRLTFISALQGQEWLRGTKGLWRQQLALSGGGQLNDSGSHLVDIMLWVTGLVPDSVFANIDNRGTEVDILSALSLKFKGGAIGTMSVVGDAPGWWKRSRSTVRRARSTSATAGSSCIPRRRAGAWTVLDVTDKLKYESNFDKNFVDSILGKDEPQTPAICGLRVMQLTEAAWESGKSGAVVRVKQ